MGDSRISWLVGLALALAALRFAIVPWAQSQVEERQQLEVLTKRLDRSAGVVANASSILTAEKKVEAATQAARSRFPEVSDKEHFRLEAQRTLGGIASRGGAKVVLYDWVLDGDAPKAGLAYGRVNATLQGALDSLVSVHGQIEAEMPYVAVREIKLDAGRDGAATLNSQGASLALVMDLYYRPTSPAAQESGR